MNASKKVWACTWSAMTAGPLGYFQSFSSSTSNLDGAGGQHESGWSLNPITNTERLVVAAASGDLETVKRLACVVDASARDAFGHTALMAAARFDHLECAAALLPYSDTRLIVGHHFYSRFTPLMIAASRGNMAMAELLAPASDLGQLSSCGRTAEEIAKRAGHEDVAFWLANMRGRSGSQS
jgi:hypothetical protein